MKKKKVVVGMSGGVDSAISAYLLKKEGYEVVGLYMRNWDSTLNNDLKGNPQINNSICPQEQDYLDAKKSAKELGIEFHRVDFIKEYWDFVFKSFIEDYKNGFTPNPDINCNKFIKFDKMTEYAFKKLNADFVATGHYAKTQNSQLFKGIDSNKDQSYFLAQLKTKQLNNIIFPLGNLTKQEVRKIAQDINLNVAYKKDSTGICFIGERKFDEFLENYIPAMPGNIVNIDNNQIVGKHNGAMYYTIGQRKGLNIGGQKNPSFLVAKDLKKKIIYVASEDKKEYLYSDSLIANNLNLLKEDYDKNNLKAKFRYRQEEVKVNIDYINDDEIKINYENQIAITPGQQLVIYENNQVVLGAQIKNIFYKEKEKKVIF